MAENEMVRQYHQLNGHECEPIPGDRGGQRSMLLAYHGLRGCKELDMT